MVHRKKRKIIISPDLFSLVFFHLLDCGNFLDDSRKDYYVSLYKQRKDEMLANLTDLYIANGAKYEKEKRVQERKMRAAAKSDINSVRQGFQ